ncbi:hypothetical protein GQ53DRAFT_95766 [Thozetella sp. PMI_491]|nr:hypothetical protein GQ53DRAFT_95766 [Thozetella sp. PMI_491]
MDTPPIALAFLPPSLTMLPSSPSPPHPRPLRRSPSSLSRCAATGLAVASAGIVRLGSFRPSAVRLARPVAQLCDLRPRVLPRPHPLFLRSFYHRVPAAALLPGGGHPRPPTGVGAISDASVIYLHPRLARTSMPPPMGCFSGPTSTRPRSWWRLGAP